MNDAVVLDSGALSGAAAARVRIRAELTLAEQLGVEVHMSSVVLVETLRGHGRDARVHTVLAGIDRDPVTPEQGRAAGELLCRTARDDTIDAIVAAAAQTLGERVRLRTGDPDDLSVLTAHMPNVTVVRI
jgi:predicted nucleic acid-binding protein